jgi:hypothetical protein
MIDDQFAGAPKPGEAADRSALVDRYVPADLRAKYEFVSYRNAAVILSESRPDEYQDLMAALRGFSLTTDMIRKAGGNESEIPKLFNDLLRPLGWHETTIKGDLIVRLEWRVPTGPVDRLVYQKRELQLNRANFIDGHKIDYVKDKVAFDLEWNSKDQTFDRDLYAFSAFAQCGVIDVAVLVTRSESLNDVFNKLGPIRGIDGEPALKASGKPRLTREKYGASTTWMGKLLYRLNAGRNGGCPVLAVGITPACISDWKKDNNG